MLRKNKRVFILLLILFPTQLMLSTFVTNVNAGPYVPESDPKNGWHWDVDVGDQLYFETEFILTNVSTGEVEMMFKDLWIYNISSIVNVTLDWLGMNQFSQVNATFCYYNVTEGELESYGYSSELALFGYHPLDSIKHKYRAGQNGMPLVLPINYTGVQVDILDDILNESFYDPMSQMGFNKFDYYESNPGPNRIFFYNSTEHYFSEAFYYPNGTLNTGSVYMKANFGSGPMYINASMTQVFDYNVTDAIDWGVNVGDSIYYDGIEDENFIDDSMELKLTVTNISDVLLEKNKNWFGNETIYMVYEAVFADLFLWNGTNYELMNVSIPIGTANNFYPQYFDMIGPTPYNFLYPANTPLEDFEFMWNNDTLRIWDIPFDEIRYFENGYIETVLRNSTGIGMVKNVVDKATGIVQSMFMLDRYSFMYFEIKTQTLVDWSVNIGSVIYIKNNDFGVDNFNDVKVTIISTHAVYVNMSALIQMYNSMGMTMTLPLGQPEYQFYSYLTAVFEVWNPHNQSWDYDGIDIFAIANIYWPISPISFGNIRGAPLLMPEGTSSSELTNLFDMFSKVYDVISYNPGYVLMRNTTLDRELHFYFDETSGRVTMMDGWANQPVPGSEWSYLSYYPKFYQALTPGTNSFTMSSHFPSDITVNIELETLDWGAALVSNYFPINPVNVSLPQGQPFAYFDMLFTNYSLINGNVTMTITVSPSIDLASVLFFFYAYNLSGTNEWDAAPPEFYTQSVSYDYATNSIKIKMPAWQMGIISAMAYFSEEFPPEIPGYDLFLISLMIIMISAVIIKVKRKKL
ncbi:MAG: hypothetical protein ACFFE5_12590 [Candidatus Thorarchaeota archaeon]